LIANRPIAIKLLTTIFSLGLDFSHKVKVPFFSPSYKSDEYLEEATVAETTSLN
jgi:hypothetical protein